MKTQYYFYPRYSKYKIIDTQFDSLKNISFFQQYQKNYQKMKKPIKIEKLSKEIISYDSIEPKNSISKKDIPITSGIKIIKPNKIKNNSFSKSKLTTKLNKNNKYTYLFKAYPKKIEPLDLQRNEKSLKENVEILDDLYLKNYVFPHGYTYQEPGIPRLLQNAYLKYTNQKRNIKLHIRGQNNYNDLKHQIISIRRNLYDPKKV
jgi:hypothetical protein